MSATVSKLHTSTDNTKSKSKPRAKGGTKSVALSVATFNRVRAGLSVTVPSWAAAFGWLGGAFVLHHNTVLAVWAYGLVALIYAVSLPHVVDGLQRITGGRRRDAVCLGIVADASMVSAETFIHFGGLGTAELVLATMAGLVGLATASYANYVAFSHH